MFQSFAECKRIMLGRGKAFYEKLVAARGKIAKAAAQFITDGSVRHTNLIYSYTYIYIYIRTHTHA